MHTLEEQMAAYAAYHRDGRNKLTHFFGVPIVVFSLFVPLSWFRFAPFATPIPLTAATLFYLGTLLYYLKLDARIALLQAPASLVLLWAADWASLRPFGESVAWFVGSFVGGWIIQLVGHWFEGRRPALTDNILQVFNAPLFLTVEVLFLLGLRRDLRAKLERRVAA
jgi:uncharacterized membrane protein YGL010W